MYGDKSGESEVWSGEFVSEYQGFKGYDYLCGIFTFATAMWLLKFPI